MTWGGVLAKKNDVHGELATFVLLLERVNFTLH